MGTTTKNQAVRVGREDEAWHEIENEFSRSLAVVRERDASVTGPYPAATVRAATAVSGGRHHASWGRAT